MKKNLIFTSIFFILSNTLFGYGTAGSASKHEPRYIVDMPTAGLLRNLNFALNSQLVSNGGFLFDATFAFFNFINVGICYGGSGVIGSETMNLQSIPGFHLKGRILDETQTSPALVLGINTQGKGRYFHDKKRYEQLSPGFYAAVSKSYTWQLGDIAVHGGMNYTFEDPNNRGINFYAGAEHTIYKYATAIIEINPNFNDSHSAIWKDKPFMLNGAIRFGISSNSTVEIQFKDFLRSSKFSTEVGRFFGIEFISKIK